MWRTCTHQHLAECHCRTCLRRYHHWHSWQLLFLRRKWQNQKSVMIAKLFISTHPVKPMDVFFSPSSVIRVYLSNAHLRPGFLPASTSTSWGQNTPGGCLSWTRRDWRSQHSCQIECLEYFKWPNLWIPLALQALHIALKSSKRFAACTGLYFCFLSVRWWLMYSQALLIVSHFSSDEKTAGFLGVVHTGPCGAKLQS